MVVVPPAVSTSKLTTVETLVQGREQKPLTATQLASVSPTEQKQLLGERLFTMIHRITPSLAGKVTGMLLEIDNSELLHMLESQESLKAKVIGIVLITISVYAFDSPNIIRPSDDIVYSTTVTRLPLFDHYCVVCDLSAIKPVNHAELKQS